MVANGVILQHFVWLIDHNIQVPVYIAEITPKTFRGGFSFTNQVNIYIFQKITCNFQITIYNHCFYHLVWACSFYSVLEFRSCSSPEIFSIGEH